MKNEGFQTNKLALSNFLLLRVPTIVLLNPTPQCPQVSEGVPGGGVPVRTAEPNGPYCSGVSEPYCSSAVPGE